MTHGRRRCYGAEVPQSAYSDHRSVIGSVEDAFSGNVVLRVGREYGDDHAGWHQTEHVVLRGREALALAWRLGATAVFPRRHWIKRWRIRRRMGW